MTYTVVVWRLHGFCGPDSTGIRLAWASCGKLKNYSEDVCEDVLSP